MADGDAENENLKKLAHELVFLACIKEWMIWCEPQSCNSYDMMMPAYAPRIHSYARMSFYKSHLALTTKKCKNNILTIQSHLIVKIFSLLCIHLFYYPFIWTRAAKWSKENGSPLKEQSLSSRD